MPMLVQSLFDSGRSSGAALGDVVASVLVGWFLLSSVMVTTLDIPLFDCEADGARATGELDDKSPVVDGEVTASEAAVNVETVNKVVDFLVVVVAAETAAEAAKSQVLATNNSV